MCKQIRTVRSKGSERAQQRELQFPFGCRGIKEDAIQEVT